MCAIAPRGTLAALLLVSVWVGGVTVSPVAAAQTSARREALISRARELGTVRVIVRLSGAFPPEGRLAGVSAARAQRRVIASVQERLLARMASFGPTAVKRFRHIPFVAMEVDTAGLSSLLSDPDVVAVEEDLPDRLLETSGTVGMPAGAKAPLSAEDLPEPPALSSSTSVIGAPNAWSSGFTGAGRVIAILDTGVESTHAFLAGKVVSEACYSSNTTISTSVCPGGAESATQAGSGINCDASIRGCDHGTHVAGIAAGNGSSFSGVAKDADLIAIQIFSRFDDPATCEPTPCVLSWTSDQILALERVFALRDSFDIASVNMSLGGGRFTSTAACDADNAARKAAIDNLRSVGIATVIAAGNEGYVDALNAPGCISSAVSVGSTNDFDVISRFSNEAPFLSLYAPGESITSSVLFDQFGTKSGTSMATPHVAGAWAVLRQKASGASVGEILASLQSTGVALTSFQGTWTTARIRVDSALDTFPSRVTAFDGDAMADFAVWEPSDGTWSILQSAGGDVVNEILGLSGDIPVPEDYDGDGIVDVAVYRPGLPSTWLILQSSNASLRTVFLGDAASFPVPGDYDGDGEADVAVYLPGSPSQWSILQSTTSTERTVAWGSALALPVPSDYDDDGETDIAVYMPGSPSRWSILQTSNGSFRFVSWGNVAALPVPADYDGDGQTDIAVYKPGSPSVWNVLQSSDGAVRSVLWGSGSSLLVPADYDGDGRADIATYKRGSPSTWNILQSSTWTLRSVPWGTTSTLPVSSPMWWTYVSP